MMHWKPLTFIKSLQNTDQIPCKNTPPPVCPPRNRRKTRMTQGRITTRCNMQLAQYNLGILEPSIWLGAAVLDFCGIVQSAFLGGER